MELLPGIHATPEACLHLPAQKVLAASDLHVGVEATLQAAGAGIPTHSSDAVVARLEAALERTGAATLIVNGDVKHGFGARNRAERREVLRVLATLAERAEVVVVRGNHDVGVETMVPASVAVADHHAVGGVVFSHGHLDDPPACDVLVLGHEHPALELRDAVGAAVRLPCFLVHDARRVIVLPALSPWARGVDVLRLARFLSPPLAGVPPAEFRAVAVGEGELLNFRHVGDVRKALAAPQNNE